MYINIRNTVLSTLVFTLECDLYVVIENFKPVTYAYTHTYLNANSYGYKYVSAWNSFI